VWGGEQSGIDVVAYGCGEALDLGTGIISADDADEDCASAQGGDIVGDIGCAAQARPLRSDAQHRDRGLRGDPADLSGHISVEHHIAKNEHGAAGEERDETGDRAVRDRAVAQRDYLLPRLRHRAPLLRLPTL